MSQMKEQDKIPEEKQNETAKKYVPDEGTR